MIFLVIENGVVVNRIEAEPDFELEGATLVHNETAQIGWLYDGTSFSPPPPTAVALPNLTMRQFRLVFAEMAFFRAVEAALAAMPGPEGEDARIEFEYASEVERGNALVSGLAGALGLTDAQIDALWVQSLTL